MAVVLTSGPISSPGRVLESKNVMWAWLCFAAVLPRVRPDELVCSNSTGTIDFCQQLPIVPTGSDGLPLQGKFTWDSNCTNSTVGTNCTATCNGPMYVWSKGSNQVTCTYQMIDGIIVEGSVPQWGKPELDCEFKPLGDYEHVTTTVTTVVVFFMWMVIGNCLYSERKKQHAEILETGVPLKKNSMKDSKRRWKNRPTDYYAYLKAEWYILCFCPRSTTQPALELDIWLPKFIDFVWCVCCCTAMNRSISSHVAIPKEDNIIATNLLLNRLSNEAQMKYQTPANNFGHTEKVFGSIQLWKFSDTLCCLKNQLSYNSNIRPLIVVVPEMSPPCHLRANSSSTHVEQLVQLAKLF